MTKIHDIINQNQRPHKHVDYEHQLQVECVRWFRYQYPQLKKRLFAVPNGGQRNAITARKLQDEGVLAGVSDLILLKPNTHYHALLIEMKTDKKYSRQSEHQKAWQYDLTKDGEYEYVVCRTIGEFISTVKTYLNNIENENNNE